MHFLHSRDVNLAHRFLLSPRNEQSRSHIDQNTDAIQPSADSDVPPSPHCRFRFFQVYVASSFVSALIVGLGDITSILYHAYTTITRASEDGRDIWPDASFFGATPTFFTSRICQTD